MTRQPLNLLENLHKTLLQFLNPFTASLSQARQARAQILKTASPTTLISPPSCSLRQRFGNGGSDSLLQDQAGTSVRQMCRQRAY
ncbi:hypothetical protein ACFX19_043082 [Malus domestica]